MQAAGVDEAERQVRLGLASALEDGLRRTLEEAMTTLKAMKGDEGEAVAAAKAGGAAWLEATSSCA